jgi:hypothetical protein
MKELSDRIVFEGVVEGDDSIYFNETTRVSFEIPLIPFPSNEEMEKVFHGIHSLDGLVVVNERVMSRSTLHLVTTAHDLLQHSFCFVFLPTVC